MKKLLVILGCLLLLGCAKDPDASAERNKTDYGQLVSQSQVTVYAVEITIEGKVIMQLTEEDLLKMSTEQWQSLAALATFSELSANTMREMVKRLFPEYYKEKGGETLK